MNKKILILAATTAMFFTACEMSNTCNYEENSEMLSCVEMSYRTVKAGGNTWMADNLMRFDIGGESYCYNDDLKNCFNLGSLYPHKIAMKICPDGWKLPTKADFEKVDLNSSKMEVLKAGFRYYDGKFADENATASFWTSDVYDDSRATLIRVNEKNEVLYEHFNKNIAASVRCIKK